MSFLFVNRSDASPAKPPSSPSPSPSSPSRVKQLPQLDVKVFDNVLTEDYILKKRSKPALIGSIDQGTSSTRFLIFTEKGRIAASSQIEHEQIYFEHKAGWHEHNPLEIYNNTKTCIVAVGDALKKKGVNLEIKPKLAAIGITNQRETTLVWNQTTGVPYYNAIVWDDTRTQTVAEIVGRGDQDLLREKTGLPLASYFAGTKVKWLLNNVEALQKDLADPIKRNEVRFGTIDSWLIYQLTGKPCNDEKAANVGGAFLTDVTNASRWLFMNLKTVEWDRSLIDTLCEPHNLPMSCLPEICPSGHVFAVCNKENGIPYLDEVPIASVLGDQQAALFGQGSFEPGEAKNTYGTGLFLMMMTGTTAVPSTHGLLTTVAYQLGKDQPVHFALEGSVSHSGSTIQWLRDQLKIIDSAPESEKFATSENDGLYFVPAFAGLFAPHWRSDARACLVGLTTSHHKGHVCRAALEAAAYQTKEVFDAIEIDSNVKLRSLKVDGGATMNSLLMQFQADMLNVAVVRPGVMETTALGVAFCAGLTIGVWSSTDEIKKLWAASRTFVPKMTEKERRHLFRGWKKAVSKSMGWLDIERLALGKSSSVGEEELQEFQDAAEGAEASAAGYSVGAVLASSVVALSIGILIGMKRRHR